MSVPRASVSELRSGLSLRANFAWTVLGNVVYSGCQGGMLIVLAKLGSASMVGQFALGLAVATPVIMFPNLMTGVATARPSANWPTIDAEPNLASTISMPPWHPE